MIALVAARPRGWARRARDGAWDAAAAAAGVALVLGMAAALAGPRLLPRW